MECRAYAICMDSQSGGHLGQDRKVPSTAGGNLSRMHKTEKTAKESRMNFMYSHLCDTTLGPRRKSSFREVAEWEKDFFRLPAIFRLEATICSRLKTFDSCTPELLYPCTPSKRPVFNVFLS